MSEEPAEQQASGGQKPQVVYHYTSMENFLAIVESGSIWTTSIDYLNDVAEYKFYLRLFRKKLPAIRKKFGLNDSSYFEETLSRNLKEVGFEKRPFVASFSEIGDSLHHWRSYCPQGNGVSIGLQMECLKRAFVQPKPGVTTPVIASNKVLYIDKDDMAQMENDVVNAIASLDSIRAGVERSKIKGITQGNIFMHTLDTIACFRKHRTFESEKEFRILVSGNGTAYDHFLFRPRKTTLRPHIPILIPSSVSGYEPSNRRSVLERGDGAWDWIESVVVGPSNNMGLTVQSVAAFLKKKRIDARVVPSTVTFRDW